VIEKTDVRKLWLMGRMAGMVDTIRGERMAGNIHIPIGEHMRDGVYKHQFVNDKLVRSIAQIRAVILAALVAPPAEYLPILALLSPENPVPYGKGWPEEYAPVHMAVHGCYLLNTPLLLTELVEVVTYSLFDIPDENMDVAIAAIRSYYAMGATGESLALYEALEVYDTIPKG